MIEQVFGDQYVHDPECQSGVGARHQRDVLVTLLGRCAPVGIDRDQLRAAALRFLRARPEMQVRDDRVAAPDQNQPAVLELLDVGPDRSADGRRPSRLACRRADRAVEQRRAKPMEETAIHRTVLQKAHRAGIRIRDDGLRAVVRLGDRGEFGGDRVECLVPRYALETGLLPSCPRAASGAARAGPNTSARGSARPWCTERRRSAGGRQHRESRSRARSRRSPAAHTCRGSRADRRRGPRSGAGRLARWNQGA